MNQYGFFSKTDSKQEIIHKIKSTDEFEAIDTFAQLKKLTINDFKLLYSVVKI